jgi:hypothetical protein
MSRRKGEPNPLLARLFNLLIVSLLDAGNGEQEHLLEVKNDGLVLQVLPWHRQR